MPAAGVGLTAADGSSRRVCGIAHAASDDRLGSVGGNQVAIPAADAGIICVDDLGESSRRAATRNHHARDPRRIGVDRGASNDVGTDKCRAVERNRGAQVRQRQRQRSRVTSVRVTQHQRVGCVIGGGGIGEQFGRMHVCRGGTAHRADHSGALRAGDIARQRTAETAGTTAQRSGQRQTAGTIGHDGRRQLGELDCPKNIAGRVGKNGIRRRRDRLKGIEHRIAAGAIRFYIYFEPVVAAGENARAKINGRKKQSIRDRNGIGKIAATHLRVALCIGIQLEPEIIQPTGHATAAVQASLISKGRALRPGGGMLQIKNGEQQQDCAL